MSTVIDSIIVMVSAVVIIASSSVMIRWMISVVRKQVVWSNNGLNIGHPIIVAIAPHVVASADIAELAPTPAGHVIAAV